jgi:hypothetical protein
LGSVVTVVGAGWVVVPRRVVCAESGATAAARQRVNSNRRTAVIQVLLKTRLYYERLR